MTVFKSVRPARFHKKLCQTFTRWLSLPQERDASKRKDAPEAPFKMRITLTNAVAWAERLNGGS
jgi:hypothetical protein